MKRSARILVCSVLAAIVPSLAHAFSCTTAASGNWDNPATWNAPCSVAGGPTAGDLVTIGAAHSIVLTGNAAATSVSITGASPGSNGLDLAGNNLSVSGAITVAAPTVNNLSSTLAVGGGTLTAGSLSLTGGNNGRVASLTVGGGSIIVNGDFTLAGTATNSRLTATGASSITVAGNFTGGARSLGGATVNVGGNFTGGTLTASSSTVNLNGNGAQNVGAYTYNNLTINKPAGTATTTGVTTVSGTLNVANGTLNVAGFSFTVTGPTTVAGTLTHSSTSGTKTFTGNVSVTGTWSETVAEAITFRAGLQITGAGTIAASTGTHTFNGTGAFSGTFSIPSVTIAGTGRYTNNGTVTFSTLSISSGGSYTNNSTTTVSTTFSGSSFGSFINAANATLNVAAATVTPAFVATASGNTINYVAAGAQTVRAATYQNLVLKGGGIKTIPASTISGDFTLAEMATARPSATSTYNGAFTIGATNTFDANSRTVNINGNFVNNGTLTTGTSTFVFSGASAQTAGGSSPLNFYNLTITNTNPTVNPPPKVTLSKAAEVTNALRLTAGTITTGANTLFLSRSDCNGNVIRTAGYVTGNLKMSFPGGTSRSCTFHVGDDRGYAAITVTTSGAGTLTGRVDGGDHPDPPVSVGIDTSKNANHYWTLTTGTLSATYIAIFRFCAVNGACVIGDDKEVDTAATRGNFILREKSGGSWTKKTATLGTGNPPAPTMRATNLSGSGTFVVGEPYSALYDHIGIFLPASSSCVGTVAATIKACLDGGCNSLYSGTAQVNLSASNHAAWAGTNPVSLTNGSGTVDLTDNTAETVTLGATGQSPLPGGSTQCYAGAAVVSCTDVLTFGPCGFDAVEVGQNAGSAILMKRANTSFNLDVLSLSTTAVTPILIEIVDASNGTCDAFGQLSQAPGSFDFGLGNQRRTVTFPATNAARNARIRVTFGTPPRVSCSSDNFSIRPANFTLAADPNSPATFRAGVDNLSILPTTSAGYNGTPRFNAARVSVTQPLPPPAKQFTVGALTEAETFGWRLDQGGSLVLSGRLRYSEVGSFNLEADAVIDETFTAVDSGKTVPDCAANRTATEDVNGCNIGSAPLNNLGRFIPAFFQTTVTPACASANPFSYSGQPFTVTTTACSGTGTCATTRNYDGQLLTSTNVTLSDAGDTNRFVNNTNRLAAANFADGVATRTDVTYRFQAPETAPRRLTIRAVDGENVASTPDPNNPLSTAREATSLIRSGRLKLDHGQGSELLALPLRVTAQYYFDPDTGWRTNTDDKCTILRTSATPAFASDSTAAPAPCRVYGGAPASCALPERIEETDTLNQTGILVNNPITPPKATQRMTAGLSRPMLSANADTRRTTLQDGVSNNLIMTAPGVAGSLGVTLLVPDYLRYNGNFPSATATFGIYKGVRSVIHIREQY